MADQPLPVAAPKNPGGPVATTPWRAKVRSAVAYRSLRGLTRFLSFIRLPTALALGRGLGDLAYLLARRHRATVQAEMRRCFPYDTLEEVQERLLRVYQHVGMNYTEVFRWIGGQAEELEKRVLVAGAEHLVAARARGKGVLVLTAHLGNWDLMGLWAAKRYPLTIISKVLREEGVNRFWMEARAASGLGIVPARKSYRACLSVLKKNGLLGFILDQNALAHEGVFVDFFGKPACTTPGLAFLSAHSQAPVVPVFMHRKLDGTHRLEILPALEPPSDREPDTVREATQRYTRIIEDVIRQHPEQWIWMHRRWRTTPPAGEQTAPAAGPTAVEDVT